MFGTVMKLISWTGDSEPNKRYQSVPITMATVNESPTEDGRRDGPEGTKGRRVQDNRIVGKRDGDGKFHAGEVEYRDDRQRGRKSEEELRQKMQHYESQTGRMKQRIILYKGENQRLWKERNQASADWKAMTAKSNQAEKELADLRGQLRASSDQNRGLQRDNQALREQLRRQAQEMKALQTASHHMETTHSRVVALLETRTSELKGAQVFLTKADTFSGADLISMVQGLNADILDTAAYMTDTFDFGQTSQTISTGRQQSVHERVGRGLGKLMAHLLVQVEHERDQTFIQIAVQACLSYWCHRIASVWIIDANSTGLNDTLADLYGIIGANEDQSVSGRWRALTRNYVQPLFHSEMDLPSYLLPRISTTIAQVLVVAGYRRVVEEVTSEVTQKFGHRIKAIAETAFRLNQTFGAEVTSCDLELMVVSEGSPFNPETTEDIGEGANSQGRADLVLCTTEVGLQRTVRDSKGGKMQETVLLKPKVALRSVTEGLPTSDGNIPARQ